jgi:starvation-inducible DNA-binding protein
MIDARTGGMMIDDGMRAPGTVRVAGRPVRGCGCGIRDIKESVMNNTRGFAIDIGIEPHDPQEIARGCEIPPADGDTRDLKTRNVHRNVGGPMCTSLHLMFETHDTELATAVDLIAERTHALGAVAPGFLAADTRLRPVEASARAAPAEEMTRQLPAGPERLVRTARAVFATAVAANDQPTADLRTQRLRVHEHIAWMLRSPCGSPA